MNITNSSKEDKEILINALSIAIDHFKKNNNTIELFPYEKMLEKVKEIEPVDYPSPKLINSFSRSLGGGFIEVFRMNYKIFKYYSKEQMIEHKIEMAKKGFTPFDGEITRNDKLIDRKLVVTYSKPEN